MYFIWFDKSSVILPNCTLISDSVSSNVEIVTSYTSSLISPIPYLSFAVLILFSTSVYCLLSRFVVSTLVLLLWSNNFVSTFFNMG